MYIQLTTRCNMSCPPYTAVGREFIETLSKAEKNSTEASASLLKVLSDEGAAIVLIQDSITIEDPPPGWKVLINRLVPRHDNLGHCFIAGYLN